MDRAPDYPRMSFPEALQRVRMFYDRERMSPANREVVARHIGYSNFSGTAKQAVAALKKYGLMSGRADQYRVTEEARQALLLPASDPERNAILHQLAFLPDLWAEIRGHFGNDAPSDTNLRSFLIKRGFNERLTKDVARYFRATVEFVDSLEVPELGGAPKQPAEGNNEGVTQQIPDKVATVRGDDARRGPMSEPHSATTHLRFKLSSTCSVELFLHGEPDLAAWDRLIQHIELTKSASG